MVIGGRRTVSSVSRSLDQALSQPKSAAIAFYHRPLSAIRHSLVKRMLEHDCFAAIGPCRNDGDGRTHEHFQTPQKCLRVARQIFERLDPCRALLPAGMLFVDR